MPFLAEDFNLGSGDLVGKTVQTGGGTWTDGSDSGAPSPVFDGNRLRQEDAATAWTYVATVPASNDYVVQVDVLPQSAGSSGVAGVCGRKNAATGAITSYWADYYDHATAGSRTWRLYKVVANVYTSLGSYTENIGTTTKTLKLSMIGSAIKVYVDGVERISATDSAIAGPGRAGVVVGNASSNTNGPWLDNWSASYIETTVTVGTATETDTADAITPSVGVAPQTISVGTASETDSAVAVTAVFNQTISVGTASETDSPGDVNVESVSGTRAQGGMALLFRSRTAPVSQTITVGTASETDTAFSVTIPANQTITVGTASETDSPGAVSVASPQTISVGTAQETDTADAVTIVLPGTIVVHPQGMVPGTSIGAYRRWEWLGPVAAKLNAGPGAAVETTTVADDLTATFTLPPGEYVAYAPAYPTRRLFFMVTE